ncbi:FecR family protein [Parapedobacter koreensis]|uniref:FecR family protein n=1 Tax=Parapedobacter koreensis TaxID=332977 RepID=A0A1H7UIQ2_9SPHI|nr:FecR family protein [Parapedobacter koreensis]SEL96689.1 FecR family protein [Parapedobacter koreensis]
MDQERLIYLYQKYQAKQLTEAEREEWEAAVLDLSQDEAIQRLIDPEWRQAEEAPTALHPDEYERIYHYIISHAQQRNTHNRFRNWVPYAAALIFALGLGFFFLDNDPKIEKQQIAQTDILPGGNKAILTLADGRTIDLSAAQSGIIVGDQITYENGDMVAAIADGVPINNNLQLATPKGGTYQVTLPDSTKVWLNAESTLQYPVQFASDKREVSLTGEGYFEVAKDSKRPFLVSTAGQNVEVLGTQFNVTAYPNEPLTKTTLVEGRVKVSNRRSGVVHVLKPGQQGIAAGMDTHVKDVMATQFTAWKDGYFSFAETPFPEVLEQLARWYDIEIVYRQTPHQTFSGKMKRNAQLLSVLDFFEGSGIQFQLEGRKLIIK